MKTIIGKPSDIEKYRGLEFNVSPNDANNFSWERGRRWLDEAIARGDEFVLVSEGPPFRGMLARELCYLVDMGQGISFDDRLGMGEREIVQGEQARGMQGVLPGMEQ